MVWIVAPRRCTLHRRLAVTHAVLTIRMFSKCVALVVIYTCFFALREPSRSRSRRHVRPTVSIGIDPVDCKWHEAEDTRMAVNSIVATVTSEVMVHNPRPRYRSYNCLPSFITMQIFYRHIIIYNIILYYILLLKRNYRISITLSYHYYHYYYYHHYYY